MEPQSPHPVAALYVDLNGIYPRLLGEDHCWDSERNALSYQGPHPVIAHPPCGPWGRFKAFCTKQDPLLALRAVEQVRIGHDAFSVQ